MSHFGNRPVVIAAGGTGGHVVPGLAIADQLSRHDVPVIWFGTRTGLEATMVVERGIDMRWIDVAGLRGKTLLETITGPVRLVKSIVQSYCQLRKLAPRAVLGMGGFVSGPVALAALLLRKPLVLHEQNAVAGMTNRWLSRFSTRVFSALPDVFPASRSAMVVGNPVIAEMEARAHQQRTVSTDGSQPLRILVVGGSRGARKLNEVVPEAVALMTSSVSVLHQAGKGNAQAVLQRYAQIANDDIEVKDFIDDMTTAYDKADIVICRSGAMTVTEISALGVPAIFIPFPFAVDDHQTKNAQFLCDTGAAQLIPESSLSAQVLAQALDALCADRQKLVRMSIAAHSCFVPNAAATVACALLEVSR